MYGRCWRSDGAKPRFDDGHDDDACFQSRFQGAECGSECDGTHSVVSEAVSNTLALLSRRLDVLQSRQDKKEAD
jgi:hypothetical protein